MGTRWSPDGRDIVFHSNADGQFKVYGIPAAGGKPRRLTSGQQREIFPTFRGMAAGSITPVSKPPEEMPKSGRSPPPAVKLSG